MEREDYAGLIYILSSIISALVFSVCLVLYLMYKQINVYLVGFGLAMLLTGFIVKRFVNEPQKK
ncbi:MAG TPA: hypothetical protein VNI84_19110 [Pyrinomonadaceae bacterium]|nr:hypothetical protein [Pyrinomonadaceae bacterium]